MDCPNCHRANRPDARFCDRCGTLLARPADVVLAAFGRYAAAGVSDLCIRFVGDDQLAQLERFTAEVWPALHMTERSVP